MRTCLLRWGALLLCCRSPLPIRALTLASQRGCASAGPRAWRACTRTNSHPLRRLYSAKLAQYRKRVWTCAATQAGELTFEEALASEAAGEKLVPEARRCVASTACLHFSAPDPF